MTIIAPILIPWISRRIAPGAMAACGFMLLYAAAHHLTGDYGLLGLSDNAIRSAAHFCGYGTLALLLSRALFNQYLLVWIISVLTATIEEIHQLVVPYRCACLEDWGINMAGITLFLVAAYVAGRTIASAGRAG